MGTLRSQIKSDLWLLTDTELKEVADFVVTLMKKNPPIKTPLKGALKGFGFEKINLENALSEIRQETENQIQSSIDSLK